MVDVIAYDRLHFQTTLFQIFQITLRFKLLILRLYLIFEA